MRSGVARSRRKSRAGETAEIPSSKDRMLAQAAELFAERGYAHVSLQEIAESAGVTKGSLFWHFENKREIYEECVRSMVEAAFDHNDARIDATDPNKRLRQYLEWVVPAMSKSRVTRRLMLRVVIEQDVDLMRLLMKGPFGRSNNIFMEILKELKPRHDAVALNFFVSAIFALNDELTTLAKVWQPSLRGHVGGKRSIEFLEHLIHSW